jgi:hypothetical protein
MHKNGETLFLMLYVDNLLIIGSFDQLISGLKKILHQEFKMTDLGILKWYLAIFFEKIILGIFLY